MSAPRIVALVSDSRRSVLAQLLAQRSPSHHGSIVFAVDGAEAARSITSGTFLLVDHNRIDELGIIGRGLVGAAGPGTPPLGADVEAWLQRLPLRTQAALRDAFAAPRAWSVKRLAHSAGVSTRQLVRHCHMAGCPLQPKDLLLAARLVSAQALLGGVRRPTARDLAQFCGWADARSLRAALRRAGLPSVAALAHLAHCHASLSDVIERIRNERA